MANNGKIIVIAERKIGKYSPGDEISIEKYAARALVAMSKARFKNEEDDFRKAALPKKRRRQYQRRDMVAQ